MPTRRARGVISGLSVIAASGIHYGAIPSAGIRSAAGQPAMASGARTL
jgi:hypothetical protein